MKRERNMFPNQRIRIRQRKNKDKSPEKDFNEMKISKLSDK